MDITFLLSDIKEINADLADFLFENGFDDATPYSRDGKSFLILDDENPTLRLQQLQQLGIKAEIYSSVDNKRDI